MAAGELSGARYMAGVVVDLPYLHPTQSRGKTYYRVRRGGRSTAVSWQGKPVGPDDPNFMAAYRVALKKIGARQQRPTQPGTFSHLIKLYLESPKWTKLSERSRKDYRVHLDVIEEALGDDLVCHYTVEDGQEDVDGYADRPRVGNYFRSVMSVLLSFAAKRPSVFQIEQNPMLRVDKLDETGPGYRPWPAELLDQYRTTASDECRWVMELAFWTGQRGADLIGMKWSDYDGEFIAVCQNKTGKKLWIACHPILRSILAEIPKHSTHILTLNRKPWKLTVVQKYVPQHARSLQYPGYSLHGLRANATIALREAGCDEREIEAITGMSPATQAIYLRELNMKTMSRRAIKKWSANDAD